MERKLPAFLTKLVAGPCEPAAKVRRKQAGGGGAAGGGDGGGTEDAPKRKGRSTAFFQFMADFRAEYKRTHEGAGVTDVAKAAGEAWRALAAEDRELYEARAARVNEARAGEGQPASPRAPRRPSERSRKVRSTCVLIDEEARAARLRAAAARARPDVVEAEDTGLVRKRRRRCVALAPRLPEPDLGDDRVDADSGPAVGDGGAGEGSGSDSSDADVSTAASRQRGGRRRQRVVLDDDDEEEGGNAESAASPRKPASRAAGLARAATGAVAHPAPSAGDDDALLRDLLLLPTAPDRKAVTAGRAGPSESARLALDPAAPSETTCTPAERKPGPPPRTTLAAEMAALGIVL